MNGFGMLTMSCLVTLLSASAAVAADCPINIDGKCYYLPKDCKHSIIGADGVFCDSKAIAPLTKRNMITVIVNGPVGEIKDVGRVTVKGDVLGNVKLSNGDIKARDIKGDATTENGEISAARIAGRASTINGSVNCQAGAK